MSILPLAAALGGVLAIGLAGVLVWRHLGYEERLGTRLASELAAHWPTDTTKTVVRRQALAPRTMARIWPILHFDPRRRAELPLPWWAVVGGALAVAGTAARLLELLIGGLAWAMLPLAWLLACRFAFGWFEARRRAALYRQFPDALGMIVRAVRVGLPVTEAMRNVGREMQAPTSTEFTRLSEQLAIGQGLETVLLEMAGSAGLAEYQFFATVLILQGQTGGSLAEMLDNLADIIRKRVALRLRAHALSAEAKTSAAVLAALPLLALLALLFIAPDYARLLFVDSGGQKVLALAIGLLLSGALVMREIIRRSLA